MKTQEELNALKEEVETLNKKLNKLNDDELVYVIGGDSYLFGCDFFTCKRNPNSCTVKKQTGLCPKEI